MLGIIQSILYVAVYECFFSAFMKKKREKSFQIAVWLLVFIYRVFVMNFAANTMINTILNFMGMLVAIAILYEAPFKVKLFMEIVALSLCSIIEASICIAVIIIEGNIDRSNRLYGIIANLIFLFVTRIIEVVIKRKIQEVIKTTYFTVLFFIMLGNLFWVILIYEMDLRIDDNFIHSMSMFLVISLLLVDIIGFKFYDIFVERRKMEKENERYTYQLELFDKQTKERITSMNEMKRLRHDLKNHLGYLYGLIQENPEEARKYIQDLMDYRGYETVSHSGNLVVDALINSKYLYMKDKLIQCDVKINIPDELPCKSADLCIILGNLLDNAIEASEKVFPESDRYVGIIIQYIKEKIYIEVKNRFIGKIDKDNKGKYLTTKKDKWNHGIGLESVSHCVENNKGILNISDNDRFFVVKITI